MGVGAIVGGGILALSGVAFSVTGPSAILAFGFNGLIALMTALSFAEMASKFPQSGGAYVFAKKVLTVEAAFLVGWVVWFASIVAAVLYAVGFGQFAAITLHDLVGMADIRVPAWLSGVEEPQVLAVGATLVFGVQLLFRNGSGGAWINISKILVFSILIATGAWAATRLTGTEVGQQLSPFFASGSTGLLQAMGFTFIALQGFDLIAAVAGEVKDPARVLPRAMLGSLGIALLIYLPLLLVVSLVGVPVGESIQAASEANPESILALAARNFLGSFGYWLVMVAALLSMLSALQANLFAASRIVQSMARDRTLPRRVGKVHAGTGTPRLAVTGTALLILLLIFALPDVAAAGAASSLIFLVTFALAHVIALVVRVRSAHLPPPFRTPWFPLIPVAGGLACLALAVYQGVMVPAAGKIALGWMGLGLLAFLVLFARHARVRDAFATAMDPEVQHLRGRNPIVLVPVANPDSAGGLISIARAITPPGRGRVLMHSVIKNVAETGESEPRKAPPLLHTMAEEAFRQASSRSHRIEWLTTVADSPWEDIAHVARTHQCESVLLGLSRLETDASNLPLDELLPQLDADVVVLRSGSNWQLGGVRQLLIPLAGKPVHTRLIARLIGSLARKGALQVRFISVLSLSASKADQRAMKKHLTKLSGDLAPGISTAEILLSDHPVDSVVDQAGTADLLLLGVTRQGRKRKLFGYFTLAIAKKTDCPLMVISARG